MFREQGVEVVTKWLNSVFQPHVEAVYQYFRNDYLMLSEPQAILYPRVPTATYPSPRRHSDGAGPSLSSRPTGERHQSLPPRTNEPQQGSGRVGGSMGNRPEVIDQSRSNRRRRRSGQMDSRRGDPGKQGLASPRLFSMTPLTRFRFPRCADDSWSLHRRTGSDRSESTRKRTKY